MAIKINKNILPPKFKRVIKKILSVQFKKNIFKTAYKKKALISYIIEPFEKDSLSHTNYREAIISAKALNKLGFRVDVVRYDCTVKDPAKYDLIYGFGDSIELYYSRPINPETTVILYATGLHQYTQNRNTLTRVQDVYHSRGEWLIDSARLTDFSWFRQTILADAIICLGNDFCAHSFREFTKQPVFNVHAPFHRTIEAEGLIQKRFKTGEKDFLWFGSAGLIHKGLDLCLEYFSQNPELNLHICGPVLSDRKFSKVFNYELNSCANITVHGFVDIQSQVFSDILEKCAFAVFPTASEGGSPSLLTVVGNGGLIPITTRESSVDFKHVIYIDEASSEGLKDAVTNATSFSSDELVKMAEENLEFVLQRNSLENYEHQLTSILTALLHKREINE